VVVMAPKTTQTQNPKDKKRPPRRPADHGVRVRGGCVPEL
jgi:hypothetical protein